MAAKKRKQPQPARHEPGPTRQAKPQHSGWSFWVRACLSVLIAWHLFVVFISPMSVSATSPLVGTVAQSKYVRWYSDPLYVNHGYHFFGPDPPLGGQLIRYRVFAADGREVAQGEFPNVKQQWPRLWYHRHMMLADQMAGIGVFGDPQQDRELMLRAYARHLIRQHDGAEARVENVFHRSLHPADVRGDVNPDQPAAPADPNDPQFYESLMTVVEGASSGAGEPVAFDRPLVPAAEDSPPPGIAVPVEEIPLGGSRFEAGG
ncbi:MAG: hypothetical protein AAGB00_04600 [Planctomycetota bacterium]